MTASGGECLVDYYPLLSFKFIPSVTSLVDAGIDAAKTRSQPDDTSTASAIKSAGLALARRATLGQDNGSPNGLMFTVPLLVTNVVSTSVYGYKAW